jgi:hypothetical protein
VRFRIMRPVSVLFVGCRVRVMLILRLVAFTAGRGRRLVRAVICDDTDHHIFPSQIRKSDRLNLNILLKENILTWIPSVRATEPGRAQNANLRCL